MSASDKGAFSLVQRNKAGTRKGRPVSENNQTQSSGRGGKRPGAGRKAGSATTRTREIADKAAADGVTPLEVMLKAMRFHMALFDETKSAEHLAPACLAAKDAAPYIHPRLASIEMDADMTIRTLAQELTELNAK